MIERILVVCIGNICRSPMAEGLFKAKLSHKTSPYHISSAGIAAVIGHPAVESALSLLKQRNIDISAHRARQITQTIVNNHDIIFTMDNEQKKFILNRYPYACGKTFLLGDEVPDPFKRGEDQFKTALELIEKGIDSWLPKLCTN